MEQSLCCTCLAETDGSIFKTIFLGQKELPLVEMLDECTGLKLNESDGISLNICDICTEEIIRSYMFRKKCWESHTFLVRRKEKSRIVNSDPIKCEMETPSKTNVSERGAVKCELCDETFYRRNIMVEHLRVVHSILECLKYECQHCKKPFDDFSNLRRHILNIHERLPFKNENGKNSTEFICHHCGDKLKNQKNFMLHIRRHTGEKPYSCTLCKYRATQQASVTTHMRTHTDERPYECEICGKLFRTSSTRATHRRGHSDETPYECIVCLKKFKQRDIYKEHMVIHDPDKYVECKYCGKKFARKKNLVVHLKQHTGEKPHVCEICGKGFIQKHCWRNHMTNHHNQ